MMKNRSVIILFSVLALVFTTSCDDVDDIYGNWRSAYDFGGEPRASGASFTIDGVFYYGLGYNSTKEVGEKYFDDFFAFDGSTTWRALAPFPGSLRKEAFSFAVDGKGYYGTGYFNDKANEYFSDVWEFTPPVSVSDSGSWRQLPNDFPGDPRSLTTSFVVDGEAYVCGGQYDNSKIFKECYKFNPTSEMFEPVASLGVKRAGAFSFVIDGIAYVGGGQGDEYDFEYYNAADNTWNLDENGNIVKLRRLLLSTDETDDISHYDNSLNLHRYSAATFVLDGKGYLLGGINGSVLRDCWVYDPTTDLWTEKTDFEYDMSSRYEHAAFLYNGVPFMMGGSTGSSFLDDMWYFEPHADELEND